MPHWTTRTRTALAGAILLLAALTNGCSSDDDSCGPPTATDADGDVHRYAATADAHRNHAIHVERDAAASLAHRHYSPHVDCDTAPLHADRHHSPDVDRDSQIHTDGNQTPDRDPHPIAVADADLDGDLRAHGHCRRRPACAARRTTCAIRRSHIN